MENPKTGERPIFLAGIITAFYPEQKYIQIDPVTVQLYTHFGITTVVPFTKINDVLYGYELSEIRKRFVEDREKEGIEEPKIEYIGENKIRLEGIIAKSEFVEMIKKDEENNENALQNRSSVDDIK